MRTTPSPRLSSNPSPPDRVCAAFSDNDRLAALVMSGLEGDALVLLTNVDGLLRNGSADSASARSISLVEEITPELKALAAGPSASGRGGMKTKLEAAEIAMNCGGTAVIANGNDPRRARAHFRRRTNRHGFLAGATDARQAALDRVCGGRSRARGGGCGRASRHHAGEGEPARFGDRARGKPFRADGRGEHRRFRGPRIRARHRQLRERRAEKSSGKQSRRGGAGRGAVAPFL